MLDFWMLVVWILVDICTPGTAFPCTVGARVREYYHLHMHSTYTYIYIHTHVHWLNQAFAVAETENRCTAQYQYS